MTCPSLPIRSLILDYDCDGAKGCQISFKRTNLLVEIEHRVLLDDALSLTFTQFLPEGFGYTAFDHEFLVVPSDEGPMMKVRLIWNVQGSLPPLGQKAWILQ